MLVCPGPFKRDDNGKRYAAESAGVPAAAQAPGAGRTSRRSIPMRWRRTSLEGVRTATAGTRRAGPREVALRDFATLARVGRSIAAPLDERLKPAFVIPSGA